MKDIPPYVLAAGVAVLGIVVAAHAFLPPGGVASVITDVATLLTLMAAYVKSREAAATSAENKMELKDQTKALTKIKSDVNHHTEMLQQRGDDAIDAKHVAQTELAASREASKGDQAVQQVEIVKPIPGRDA